MQLSLLELLDRLEPDPWRAQKGFSPDIVEAHNVMFSDSKNETAKLSQWLANYQPCLFGRAAAKLGLVRFCVLRESDITSDEAAYEIIQDCRRKWTADAFEGKASAFIVVLVSPRVIGAVPNENVLAVAHRLCSLYLPDAEIKTDYVHHDRVWLEKPGVRRMTWEWLAGVNYFCAQGDQRWWHDHRIPGGLGFSVNSVGHLARSGKIAEAMNKLNLEVGGDAEEFGGGRIRSLAEALTLAMLTIDNASNTVSGRATELLPLDRSAEANARPACPVKLPKNLAEKDYCAYQGWYHTDYTLPKEYFLPNVERPQAVERHGLDFTYLFNKHVDNLAFETMGEGRQIREDDYTFEEVKGETKVNRMEPREVPIESRLRLQRALSTTQK